MTYGELVIQSRVHSPSEKKDCIGFIQCKLDYILTFNSLQEFVNDTNILTSLSIDHSRVHLSVKGEQKHKKLNSSLIKDHKHQIMWIMFLK